MKGTMAVCLVFFIYGVGCAEHTADPEQIAWHDRLVLASNKTSDAHAAGKPLSVQALIDGSGQPDVKTTMHEIRDVLSASGAPIADRADLKTLYFAYRLFKHLSADETAGWESDQDFLKTPAWIYDERKHFGVPLPDSSGFDSYVFLISGDEVIGSSVIIASPVWKRAETHLSE